MVDFEGGTSRSYLKEDLDNELTAAKESGQRIKYDMLYNNCVWGYFDSYGDATLLDEQPASPEKCSEAALSGGWDGKELYPGYNKGEIRPGVIICTTTDQGVALVVMKAMTGGEANSMNTPEHVTMRVSLWKKN
ncbi:hypothetical protein [Micromonospora sp. NPDC023737]|uniref:hypothetical protein n=1 Tax=unclassified Micromonospora TaxID=2617518 RepID=UPI0033D5FBFA